jgi:FlaA1/EpsC-like NDP-sugar epimerase
MELAFVMALLFGLSNTLLGLKTVEWSRAASEEVLRLFVSCALVTAVSMSLQAWLDPIPILPVPFMVMTGLMVLVGLIAVRYRLRLVTGLATRWIALRRGRSDYGNGERVLVVGAGAGSEFATWLLRRPDFRGLYTIKGIADDAPAKQGQKFDGVQVLGTTADIPGLVLRHDIGVIFYAISKISEADNRRILETCRRTGARLVLLPDMLETIHSQLRRDVSVEDVA